MPHRRSHRKDEARWRSHLDFLRKRALETAFYDRELVESVYVSTTTYYPEAEVGEVLADTRGRGSFQRKL